MLGKSSKEYRCRCDRYCKGIERVVSQTKWYKHRAAEFIAPSNGHTATPSTASGSRSATQSNPAKRMRRTVDVDSMDGRDDILQEHDTPSGQPQDSLLHTLGPVPPQPGTSSEVPSNTPPARISPAEQQEHPGSTTRFDDTLPVSVTGSVLPELDTAIRFRSALENTSLENGDLSPEQVENLRNPTSHIEDLDADILLSLKLFLSTHNAAESVYQGVRADLLEDSPEREILSNEAIKKTIAEMTGVSPIVHGMCPKSCIAYTGPYSTLDACLYCKETRLDLKTKKPRQYFYTMPLGPQIQARWKDPESAALMQHQQEETDRIFEQLADPKNNGHLPEYTDVYHGQDYLEAIDRGDIRSNDMVLMFSMDRAQLYRDKKSDCWIYIWVILDMSPEHRYKKKQIIPGGVIPGPNNPEHMESFLFPGFHHLAALQKEGLQVFNSATGLVVTNHPFLLLGSADGPGGTYFTGFVGHHGYYFCRLYCGISGRHKPEGSHYYGALLKPNDYTESGCDHGDIDAFTLGGPNPQKYHENLLHLLMTTGPTDYKARRKITGLSSTSIFSGLPQRHRLPVPQGFLGDSMHVPTLNLGDLLLPLWRGTFTCDPDDSVDSWEWAVLKGRVWTEHGAAVGACRSYLPGSFDRPPRNLVEKIKSGYKAKEWQHYFYGIAVALLYKILPHAHWRNFCKLVYAIRLLHQRTISRAHLEDAHQYMAQFHEEYELLYGQRKTERLHFMRPCLHFLLHMALETVCMGPVPLFSTWTMERMIGDLGGQIHQPSNPYHNLSECGLQQCQINALTSTYPQLLWCSSPAPKLSERLGDGYAFLSARERTPQVHSDSVGETLQKYFVEEEAKLGNAPTAGWKGPKIRRWGRLQLPNGQIARCAWKECAKPIEEVRRARCVKLHIDGEVCYAEVMFYFFGQIGNESRPLALISLYSQVDAALFEMSYWTLQSVHDFGEAGLRIVDAKSIMSVVAAIPWAV